MVLHRTLSDIIKELEDTKEHGIPEEIREMINMDEWYDAWDLAFDKAITIIQKRKDLASEFARDCEK